MKKLLLIPLLMTLPFVAHANETDRCAAISSLAEGVMTARQNNVDIVQVIEIVSSNPITAELGIVLAKEAYAKPRFNTERIQKETIREFKNDVYLQCLNARN